MRLNLAPHLALVSALLLYGCTAIPRTYSQQATPPPPAPRPTQQTAPPPTVAPPAPTPGYRMPEIMQGPGLEGVIRQEEASLVRQFGTPRLTVAEGDMKKLQFAAPACVLDIYLYPLAPGGTPVATWLQSRRSSDGQEVDMRACMAAIRAGAR